MNDKVIVSDLKTLWGIHIGKLLDYGKRCTRLTILLYILNIITIIVSSIIMYKEQSDFATYVLVLFIFCFVFCMWLNEIHIPSKMTAYSFFRKVKSCLISEVTVDVNAETLYSILYCVGSKRLKQNKSELYYKELILSTCCENKKYANKIMDLLMKYESEIGTLKVYYVTFGNKNYLLDFKEDE